MGTAPGTPLELSLEKSIEAGAPLSGRLAGDVDVDGTKRAETINPAVHESTAAAILDAEPIGGPIGGAVPANDDEDDMFGDPVADASTDAPAALTSARQLDEQMVESWSDPDGYYRNVVGELLDGRYTVQAILGKGVFSTVVRALDRQNDISVAIKIIRDNEVMSRAATKEIKLLQALAEADVHDQKHVIRLLHIFVHRRHTCMVFEGLELNLRDVLRKFGKDVGISMIAVRAYARQIFLALSLFKQCGIMHADLKPDNILVDATHAKLKICDLGSASLVSENEVSPYLASRFYRAPELMLGCPHDTTIDTWSIGCTLFELYSGRILFPGTDNNHMLQLIQECRGRLPKSLVKKGVLADQHFDITTGDFLAKSQAASIDLVRRIAAPLKQAASVRSRLEEIARADRSMQGKDLEVVRHLIDLIERCLELDPARRISPLEALSHAFFRARV